MLKFIALLDRAVIVFFLLVSILGFLLHPHLLLGTDFFHSLFWGMITGLLVSTIGYLMFLKIKPWAQSVSYLVGNSLSDGSLFRLCFISLMAGIWEELYTRGFLLLINDSFTLRFWLLCLVINLIWAFSHVFNRYKDLIKDYKCALLKSLPHIIVVFLSGIPFMLLTFYFKSLMAAMVAHFTLDFAFGIIYRSHKSSFNKKAPFNLSG